MKTLLTKIFSSLDFVSQEVSDDSVFFKSNADGKVEYYLVYITTRDMLKTYESASSFIAALEFLRQQNETQSDISKNTSLLLCVQMEDLRTDSIQCKHDILKIEEEEFQYKHYVLPYVSEAVSNLNTSTSLLADLNTKVNDEGLFQQYFRNPYEDPTYFLAIQLFLKLPFLGPIPYQTANFIPIDTLVDQYIESVHANPFYVLAISDAIYSIDWEDAQRHALDLSTQNFEEIMLKLK